MHAPDRRQDILALMPYSIPQRVVAAPQPGRRQPLELEHPVDIRHVIRVNADQPRGIRLPPTQVDNEFVKFSFATSTSRLEAIFTFAFSTKTGEVPLDKMRLYSSGLQQMHGAVNWMIAFSPRKRGFQARRTLPDRKWG